MNTNEDLRARLPELPEPVDYVFSPDGNGAALGVYTEDQMRDYAIAALARKEAGPNDDDAEGFDAVLRHGFFIQEVDFGDEGKGYFVRMRDFNTIAARLDECLARQEEGREAVGIHDDTDPVMAGLAGIVDDGYATDYQRRAARAAYAEIKRLREIEHRAWHVFDDSEDTGETYVISKHVSANDLSALFAAMPEGHPTPPIATPTPHSGGEDADELSLRVRAMDAIIEVTKQYPDTGASIASYVDFLANERMRLWEKARHLATPTPQAAGVSDAVVERAVEMFLSNTGQAHAVTQLQRDLTTGCMRAALNAVWPTAAGAAPEGCITVQRGAVNALLQFGTCHEMSSEAELHTYVEARDLLLNMLAAAPNPGAQHGQEGRDG